jgi:hypothetical protein
MLKFAAFVLLYFTFFKRLRIVSLSAFSAASFRFMVSGNSSTRPTLASESKAQFRVGITIDHFRRQRGNIDNIPGCEKRSSSHHISELSEVAWPVIMNESVHDLITEPGNIFLQFVIRFLQKEFCE